jgi:TPR repeat protein
MKRGPVLVALLAALLAALTAQAADGLPPQAVAAWELGLKQRNGIGMAADAVAARASFQQAAQDGVPAAMFMLAQMQAAGEGGVRDPGGAGRWIERAAQMEYPEALQELALQERDPERAGELLREAAHALEHRVHERRGAGY